MEGRGYIFTWAMWKVGWTCRWTCRWTCSWTWCWTYRWTWCWTWRWTCPWTCHSVCYWTANKCCRFLWREKYNASESSCPSSGWSRQKKEAAETLVSFSGQSQWPSSKSSKSQPACLQLEIPITSQTSWQIPLTHCNSLWCIMSHVQEIIHKAFNQEVLTWLLMQYNSFAPI